MKRDNIYSAVVLLCVIINVYATARRFWPSKRFEEYSYVGDDFPEHLPVENQRQSTNTVFDQSANFPIVGPAANDKWQTIYPPGHGFVRMGEKSRLLCTAMFHQMHCLEKMRIFLDDPFNHDVQFAHQQHCMNYLRQLFLCKADVTLEPIHISHELDLEYDLSTVSGNGVVYSCGDSEVLYRTVGENYADWKGRWNISQRAIPE